MKLPIKADKKGFLITSQGILFMKKIEKTFDTPAYIKNFKLLDLENSVFFDIETTSLSAKNGHIYIIAVLYKISEDKYNLIQWFADSLLDEQKLLTEFKDFIKDFNLLIHFNGDSFDIPFINKAALSYGMEPFLSELKSMDIYRKACPFKKVFDLSSIKQKSIEEYFGINRKDLYNGGELISIYNTYTLEKSKELLDTLLLHNEEDVLGLLSILPLLAYYKLFEADINYESYELEDSYLSFACNLHFPLPRDISLNMQDFSLYTANDVLYIKVLLYKGESKHFFEDYKNYYYLPLEDMAIHKSIANFVDSSSKVKAKKQNAYIKLNSCFIPIYHQSESKLFRKEFADKQNYIELNEKNLSDDDFSQEYCKGILAFLYRKLNLK